MNTMCPVSFVKVNENAVRITAAQAVLAILLFLFSSWKWIILIVAADFFVRGFGKPEYSLFAKVSKKILEIVKVKPVMTDAAPHLANMPADGGMRVSLSVVNPSGLQSRHGQQGRGMDRMEPAHCSQHCGLRRWPVSGGAGQQHPNLPIHTRWRHRLLVRRADHEHEPTRNHAQVRTARRA